MESLEQKIANPGLPFHTPDITVESEQHAFRRYPASTVVLSVPEPIIGAKGHLFDVVGNFVLEEGPGVLRAIACTHTGSCYLTICDGLNGRRMFKMHPVVLGQYMLDMGFLNGLAVEIGGGMAGIVTITWMTYKRNGNGKTA